MLAGRVRAESRLGPAAINDKKTFGSHEFSPSVRLRPDLCESVSA